MENLLSSSPIILTLFIIHFRNMPPTISFDWSQGRAFVQEGTIFYSPNCSRTVLIPMQVSTTSPFYGTRIDASLFKQPVWWTDVYGWQSFIPLAPSFTSSPFEPFCWVPRIVEVDVLVNPHSTSGERQRRYQMHPDDALLWSERERLIVEAAERIRIWYKIPGNLPPPPSRFNYSRAHKSKGIAKKMISLSRDWFGVWIGFLSYLIACTKRNLPSRSTAYKRPDPNSPFPVWHQRLQESHKYPADWLDGLCSSTVCSFDTKTPRAGVVFEWSKADNTRPDISWFLDHNIPLWFVWSKEEERAILHDRSLSFLKPPNSLIQEALSHLFNNPSSTIPLAGLIINRYYNMGSDPVTNETVKLLKFKEAPSFVLESTTRIFLGQTTELERINEQTDENLKALLISRREEQRALSLAEAAVPTQTMIEDVERKGKLYNHWQDFLEKREKRQAEILKVESTKDRQKRISRSQKPGVKNADIYTWEKIRSSGGKEVYMRLRVDKKRNEQVFSSFKQHQRIYNALTNEWDLCKEFGRDVSGKENIGNQNVEDSDSDDASDEDEGFNWLHEQYPRHNSEPYEVASSSFQRRQQSPLQRDYSPSQNLHVERDYSPSQNLHVVSHCLQSPEVYFPTTPPRDFSPQRNSYAIALHHHAVEGDYATTPPREDNMDIEENDDAKGLTLHYSQDVIEFLSYGYGYVPAIPSESNLKPFTVKEWETAISAFGFVTASISMDFVDFEKRAIIDFFNNLAKKIPLPSSSDDLNSDCHAALCHLFDFAGIHRPSEDLFVFSAPRSTACNWLLGVNSPEVALYVCRYILSNPRAHTIVTVANRLLHRGVPFRTLLGMDSSARWQMNLIDGREPPSFRYSTHLFTPKDFDASMLRCQSVLSQPQGRAALLKGGIIWRIAKQFLSTDGVLDGPSIEVTSHRVGYSHISGTSKVQYCDDDLTENEIDIICGTYSLYTSSSFFFFNFIFFFLLLLLISFHFSAYGRFRPSYSEILVSPTSLLEERSHWSPMG
jgi:hypothetical protein